MTSKMAEIAPAQSHTLRRTSLWVTSLQFLLVVSWTLYVLFLPPLLDAAGIGRRWFVWLLALDQALFAVSDWAAGVYADRISRALRRIGPPLIGLAVVSSLAMLALPWVAQLQQPWLLILVTVVWSVTSSSLRAPAFSLLARAGGVSTRSGIVSLALFGVSLGGALGPLLTNALRGADPRLPLACAAVALAAAALFVSRVEAGPPRAVTAARTADRAWVIPLVVAMFVAAFGMQLHTALASDALYKRFAPARLDLLRPTFWIGFAAGLLVAASVGRLRAPLRAATMGLLAGASALAVAYLTESLPVLIAAQLTAGAAWGVALTAILATALARGGPASAGTPCGLIFSALAVAALARLLIVAAGVQATTLVAWLPVVAWAFGAALLLRVRQGASAKATSGGADAPAEE